MSLSLTVEGIVELSQNILFVYELSKRCNLGMTEYIDLEPSGNNKGDD